MILNALFSDGAVFQRQMVIPVFGKTDKDSIVEISFNGRKFYGMAGTDGSFLIRMTPQEAGGPYTMDLRNTRTGDSAQVKNILIGEVWLASGQSNMEYMLRVSPGQMQEFIDSETDPDSIRMFTVPHRAPAVPENQIGPTITSEKDIPEAKPGDWTVEIQPRWVNAKSENLPLMSAVATWFARKLRDELHVPVGILSSSWGGTIAEAWTSIEMLLTNPDQRAGVEEYLTTLSRPERWANLPVENPMFNFGLLGEAFLIEKYCTPNPPDAGTPQGWGQIGFDDSPWADFSLPGSWIYNKLGGNGVVWVRKTVDVPADWAGKDLELHLGGIDKHDATFFNGECVGETGKNFETKYYDTLRCYTVPGKLVKAGKNVVSVRAYSFIYDGAFLGEPKHYYLSLPGTEQRISLAGACKLKVEVDFHFAGFPNGEAAMGPHTANTYANLYDAMIRPLIPYAIRGAIWYQGESNAHSIEKSKQYERLMTDMIRDWRFRWCEGDFPFIQVTLAGYQESCPYSEESTWGHLRNSQRKAMLASPNSGLASALDVGDARNIHPGDKRTVGFRLALWALENTYHLPGVFGTSPEVKALYREGAGKLRLTFDHCAKGLVAKNGRLDGFYVADSKSEYKKADAILDGNSVVLTCSELPLACSVRYAWSQNPMDVTSLYNSEGLPANPFEIGL